MTDEFLKLGYWELKKLTGEDEYIRKELEANDIQEYSTQVSYEEYIFDAAELGYTEIFIELIERFDYDPNSDSNLLFQIVSSLGHSEMVDYLLKDSRVDPSDENNVAIEWASLNKHKNIVEKLLTDQRVVTSLSKEKIEEYRCQV